MKKVFVAIDLDYSTCYYEGDRPDLKVLGVVTPKREFKEYVGRKDGVEFLFYYNHAGKKVFPDYVIEVDIPE